MAILKKGFDFSGNKWVGNAEFNDLFSQIMHLHPGKRIHPEEILEHEFMASKMMVKAHRQKQAAAPQQEEDDYSEVEENVPPTHAV